MVNTSNVTETTLYEPKSKLSSVGSGQLTPTSQGSAELTLYEPDTGQPVLLWKQIVLLLHGVSQSQSPVGSEGIGQCA